MKNKSLRDNFSLCSRRTHQAHQPQLTLACATKIHVFSLRPSGRTCGMGMVVVSMLRLRRRARTNDFSTNEATEKGMRRTISCFPVPTIDDASHLLTTFHLDLMRFEYISPHCTRGKLHSQWTLNTNVSARIRWAEKKSTTICVIFVSFSRRDHCGPTNVINISPM